MSKLPLSRSVGTAQTSTACPFWACFRNKILVEILRGSLILVLTLSLIGCGGPAPENQPDFVPIQPDPTATSTAISGNQRPERTPTSVVSDQVDITTYTHPSNRFSIQYPENWQTFDRPDGVVFVEPGNRVGYSVIFTDVGELYSDEELNQFVVTFVAKNFVDEESGFSAISQETRPDGSIVAQFKSVDPNLGQAINEVRVRQQETIVYVVLISATEEQWQISHQKLQNLAGTLTPLDTSPAVEPTPTEEPITWVLIGPTTNRFGFLYPSDWQVLQQNEAQVLVKMPEYEITFEGAVSEEPVTETDDPVAAAEEAALAYLEGLSNEHRQLQSMPPAEFPLDEKPGSTIDFLYSTSEGKNMAGSLIMAVSEGHLYRVTFMAPAEMYEGALEWFNPMYKSFTILPAADIVEPE